LNLEQKIIHLLWAPEGIQTYTLRIAQILGEPYDEVFDAIRRLIAEGRITENQECGGWMLRTTHDEPYTLPDSTPKPKKQTNKHWGY